MTDHSTLIVALQNADLYDHAVEKFTVIETHISWVILTGPYAYKIKKPVNLGFLDFSSLERRRRFCAEELRLNRRLAPDLYLDVVTITGSDSAPQLNGNGAAIEYAVRMRQFPQRDQLDRVLERNGLRDGHIDQLAATVARFHASLPVAADDTDFGRPETVHRPVTENFSQLRPLLTDPAAIAGLRRLETWSNETHTALHDHFQSRRDHGFIRECHGDMHLANMVLIDDRVVVFDCIEFSAALRWIDVMSEIAFVVMDLDDRERPRFGARFLNAWLEHSGDYDGLRVLRYYQVYRALVRAKVTAIRLRQPDLAPAERQRHEDMLQDYLQLAEDYTRPHRPLLIITHGFSGSGKTVISQSLLEHLGAIRIRSDVERKRLAGMAATERGTGAVAAGLYNVESSRRTYERLADLAGDIIAAGYPVVVDAAFLERARRDAFRELAARLNVRFVILDCQAPEDLLRQWIAERAARNTDASDAGIAVLEHQMATHEPLAPDEQAFVRRVNTAADIDMAGLAGELGHDATPRQPARRSADRVH